jgi:[NiFe] hydrogenase assembly HybE family chaperone
MTNPPVTVSALVRRFDSIHRQRMSGLPIVNPRLDVEAVGFGYLDEHQLGILITPWFMNLVLLPGTDEWSEFDQGSTVNVALPNGEYDFVVGHDDTLGVMLTAVLFRSVSDFPNQESAAAVAQEVLRRLWSQPDELPAPSDTSLSRRDILTGLGAG